jgi:NADH dehydrogenase
MLKVIRRRRLIMNIPFGIAGLMGWSFDLVQTLSFGLIPPQITRDQVRNLARDNVVAEGAKGFADLGIEPVSLEAVLPDYLWPYRPSGQYAAIKASARNLRQG